MARLAALAKRPSRGEVGRSLAGEVARGLEVRRKRPSSGGERSRGEGEEA